ncbi:unnamed protein product [Acanthoscelides obtectus]|uniref:Uncharacterized protein n=1 Tax=Acanthoscelides obtectus TaxID=200917 RepID=A0A9P0PI00_ACAOB|nr:unnamed protein product [Acanthoscelides obtectus]CAK1655918.1 hypothetical protein AOBTE_LOCUS19437 [Acanthoscelides obtectus]
MVTAHAIGHALHDRRARPLPPTPPATSVFSGSTVFGYSAAFGCKARNLDVLSHPKTKNKPKTYQNLNA